MSQLIDRPGLPADARSAAFYPALIEHSLDLIATLDDQGTITFQSPSALRILGYYPAELVGRNAFELIHPEDRDRVRAEFDRASQVPGPTSLFEYRFQHKNESWRVLESIGSAVNGPNGTLIGIVNSRDITERRALKDQVHQAQRVATLGRLAGSVVHEFYNSLQVMTLGLDSILETNGAPAATRELQSMRRSVELATTLARQLLELGRASDYAPRAIDLNAAVASMLPILRRLTGRHIRIETRLHAEPMVAQMRFGALDQILLNLVGNARDAIRESGTIVIETRRLHDRVILDVDDDGAGIPLRLQDRIFEPFFTTKAASGNGLGLSTVRDIVEEAGGRIEVRSAIGCGATFTVTLPASDMTFSA